jgi:hypothetical protein
MRLISFLSFEARLQKKLAPNNPTAKFRSAMVWAMVDLPVPANSLNQKTRPSEAIRSELLQDHIRY